jgi:hypothetical protein
MVNSVGAVNASRNVPTLTTEPTSRNVGPIVRSTPTTRLQHKTTLTRWEGPRLLRSVAKKPTSDWWRDPALYEVAARAIAIVALLMPAEGAAVRLLAFQSAPLPNALSVAVSATLVDLTAIGVVSVLAGTYLVLAVLTGLFVLAGREDKPERDQMLAEDIEDLKSRMRSERRTAVLYVAWLTGLGVFVTLLSPIDSTVGLQGAAMGASYWVIYRRVTSGVRVTNRFLGLRDVAPIVVVVVGIVIVPAGLGYQPPLAKVDFDPAAKLPNGNYLMLGERDNTILLGSCTPQREVVAVQMDAVLSAVFLAREQTKLPSYLDILRGAPLRTGMTLACEIAAPAR